MGIKKATGGRIPIAKGIFLKPLAPSVSDSGDELTISYLGMKLQQFRCIYKIVDKNKLMPQLPNVNWHLQIERSKKNISMPYSLVYRCEGSKVDYTRLTGLHFIPKTNNRVLSGNIKAPDSDKEYFYLAIDKAKDVALIFESGFEKLS